ncbi:hypothetical protein I547_4780 [Mycobacterium kansasii 824]|nr:hypothetical protein I547_4780 [Mycobacterium kansasii 824]
MTTCCCGFVADVTGSSPARGRHGPGGLSRHADQDVVASGPGCRAGILYRLHLDLASLSIAEFYADGASSVRLVNQTGYL